MKLLILLVATASAVTIYSSEDNVAMESNAGRQQNVNLTSRVDAHKPISSRYRENSSRGKRQKERETQDEQQFNFPVYFEKHQQDNGQSTGYSSYVQHSEEVDAINKGSNVEIKKVAPKSTVQFEMYHDTEQQQQQQQHAVQQQKPLSLPHHSLALPQQTSSYQIAQKEASHAKLKNKPPKFYHDTLANYKKGKLNNKPLPDPFPLKRPYSEASNSDPVIYKPKSVSSTYPRRRPFTNGKREAPPSMKDGSTPGESYGPPAPAKETKGEDSSKPNREYLPQSFQQSSSAGSQSTTHDATNTPTGILPEGMGSAIWKPLSDSVEIANSEEVPYSDSMPKTKRSRKPKEVAEYYSQKKFFDKENVREFGHGGDQFGEHRFKAERFDHEKALKGSTPFNIENVMGFGHTIPDADIFSDQKLLPSPLNINPIFSQNDFTKELDLKLIGTSRAPVQFNNQQASQPSKVPVFSLRPETIDLPVMTEEQFEKAFGKFRYRDMRNVGDQKPKALVNRVPFDYRSLPKSQFSSSALNSQLSLPAQNLQLSPSSHKLQLSSSPLNLQHPSSLHNLQLSSSSHIPQVSSSQLTQQLSSSSHLLKLPSSHTANIVPFPNNQQAISSSHIPQQSLTSHISHHASPPHNQQLSLSSQNLQVSSSSHNIPQLSSSSHHSAPSHNQQLSSSFHNPQHHALANNPQFSVPSQSQLKHLQKRYPPQSFTQYGGASVPDWANEKNENVDVTPQDGLGRHLAPQGRVLNDDNGEEPQQFSVSASYQIDRQLHS